MERRTILKRLGAASAGIAGLSGVASAEDEPEAAFAELDRTVDVSGRSGPVPLTELFTEQELVEAGSDIDLTTVSIVVDESQTTLDLNYNHCCYNGCCEYDFSCPSYCSCCYCDNCYDDVREA